MGHLENLHSIKMCLMYLQKPPIHCAQFGTRIAFLKNTWECELNIEVDPVNDPGYVFVCGDWQDKSNSNARTSWSDQL